MKLNILFYTLLICLGVGTLHAQKKLYIPNEWKDTNLNVPWDSVTRCKQSANFAVFWGPLAGDDPANAMNTALRFDPQRMLDTMEVIFNDYVNKWHLLPDSGNLAKYKCVIVMNNTWRDGLYTGYLFGGGFDNIIGAMFIDPPVVSSPDSWGLSHEFTHSCQYMITNSLYPGHGFNDAHSGFFWETHAQFMAWQRYPDGLGNADPARAINFTSYNMASARKHYANLYYVDMLKEKYGLDFIGRIWREADLANKHEHPFETMQRLLGFDQPAMNKLFMEHAMRNVKWDYNDKAQIQQAIDAIGVDFQWRTTDILDSLGFRHYAIADRLAPQQYGYNIVRLYPDKDSTCTVPYVQVNFKGHTDTNASSGWLYGFVSVDASGITTYSNQYPGNNGDVIYKFPAGATEYYMVVMGAPTTFHVHKDLFEIGFPKEFRYAWEVNMKGMVPQGYQPDFRNTAGIAGAAHPNGGGFVASTAHADATAYVGQEAAVLGNAAVTGNARIEGKALLKDNVVVSDNAVISDFALVSGGSTVNGNARVSEQAMLYNNCRISDSAVVKGNAVVFDGTISAGAKAYGTLFSWGPNLGGTAQYGGDAEVFAQCNAGTYLQPDGLLSGTTATPRAFCDGLADHILNVDTNKVYTHFSPAEMAFGKVVVCGDITGNATAPVVNAGLDQQIVSDVSGITLTGTATSSSSKISNVRWTKVAGPDSYTIADAGSLTSAVSNLSSGIYLFELLATDSTGNQASDTVRITVLPANILPVADAGADKVITLPVNYVTLVATGSDPDGYVEGIHWTQYSGPSAAYVVSPGSLTSEMDNLQAGTYQFIFTVTDNLGAKSFDTVSVIVNSASSTGGNGEETAVNISPNPASDMVTVNYPIITGGYLNIFDAKGRKVLTKELGIATSSATFSVQGLSAGSYFIRIDTNNNDKYKIKLIVTH